MSSMGLSPAVLRMLHDKLYEKRKSAALEIEKCVLCTCWHVIKNIINLFYVVIIDQHKNVILPLAYKSFAAYSSSKFMSMKISCFTLNLRNFVIYVIVYVSNQVKCSSSWWNNSTISAKPCFLMSDFAWCWATKWYNTLVVGFIVICGQNIRLC